jgi:phage terminase small subunit
MGRKSVDKVSVQKCASPLEFLLAVMNDQGADVQIRIKAAQAAAQYMHTRTDRGKKEQRRESAERAGRGRYAPAEPPRLALIGGKGGSKAD